MTIASFTCRKKSRWVTSWISSSLTSSGKNLARNRNCSGDSFRTSCDVTFLVILSQREEPLVVHELQSEEPDLAPDRLGHLPRGRVRATGGAVGGDATSCWGVGRPDRSVLPGGSLWMANSSSVSIVVTRTLICAASEGRAP